MRKKNLGKKGRGFHREKRNDGGAVVSMRAEREYRGSGSQSMLRFVIGERRRVERSEATRKFSKKKKPYGRRAASDSNVLGQVAVQSRV